MNSFTLTMHARARRKELKKTGRLPQFVSIKVRDNKIIIHLQVNEKQEHKIIADVLKKIA